LLECVENIFRENVGMETQNRWASAILGVLAWSVSCAALAHGGGGSLQDDQCRGVTGSYSVHFTAYQPQFSAGTEYCWDVPKAGNAIIAFDLVQKELREIPTEIRIVQEAEGGGDNNAPGVGRTVAEKGVQTYPRGTVALDANLAPPGRYIAVITFNSTVPTIIKIPIRVEMTAGARNYIYIGAALVGAILIAVAVQRRKGGSGPAVRV
jgi:hypothetical protein